MVAVLATAAHLLALGASAAVELSWVQILVFPWTTPYNPTAAILGWLATLCLLATAASGVLKRRLPNWRAVHYASYATFVLGLLHGLIAGTNSGSPPGAPLLPGVAGCRGLGDVPEALSAGSSSATCLEQAPGGVHAAYTRYHEPGKTPSQPAASARPASSARVPRSPHSPAAGGERPCRTHVS